MVRPVFTGAVLDDIVPLDNWEFMELFDMVEAIDSEDFRLLKGAEGRLGGRDGVCCEEDVRGGSLGGAGGLAGFETNWPAEVMVGGGRTPFCRLLRGSLPMLFLEKGLAPKVEGTLVV